jgi:uncharacterized protein
MGKSVMINSIEVIRKEEQKTTTWSGGTTTELTIYPKDAIYSNRNFKWRLSSAKVNEEKSTFTSLQGIWRLIMVVEGEMALEHENQHSTYLKPFDQDSFSGEWSTKSVGKVKDFNLMLSNGCKGELEAIQIKKGDFFEIKEESSNCNDGFTALTEAFYCVKGNIVIDINKIEKFHLNHGDFLLINMERKFDDLYIKINAEKEQGASIIRSSILY